MSVTVGELEVVPEPTPPPPGEPAPRAAPDAPPTPIEDEVERVVHLRESRALRLRAD